MTLTTAAYALGIASQQQPSTSARMGGARAALCGDSAVIFMRKHAATKCLRTLCNFGMG